MERRSHFLIAFAAGAVAMLAVALAVFAWQGRRVAGEAAQVATEAAKALPVIAPPKLPDAPRIPDGPVPKPR